MLIADIYFNLITAKPHSRNPPITLHPNFVQLLKIFFAHGLEL